MLYIRVMLRRRNFIQLRRVVLSNKFYIIVTTFVFLICSFYIFFTDIETGFVIKKRTKTLNIYKISWLLRKTRNVLLDCNEGLSKERRESLRKKQTRLLQMQMTRHKKHVFNYTSCLSQEAKVIDENFDDKSPSYPLSFEEMVKRLHEQCKKKIFGKKENKCRFNKNEMVGDLAVNKTPIKMRHLKQQLNFVRLGGVWSPTDCIPEAKVAVIIPFQDRSDHLSILLRQLHPILKKQNLLYRIFVIEQDDEYPFNRGKLMNVGYTEALKMFDFDCFVFHDVDLIPENDLIDYGCSMSPKHLSVAVDKFNYILPYDSLFGGVEMFSKDHFRLVNGFSNSYWGWGAEDDDMYKRLVKNKLKLARPSIQKGRYTMMKHNPSESPPDRHDKLQSAAESFSSNGLVTLLYKVKKRHENLLFTLIRVDLKMEDDMLY